MKNTETYKKLLLAEKAKLTKELETVGRRNPAVPGDWEAVSTDLEVDSADENEVADEVEELGSNSGILEKLEPQLASVNRALKKLDDGTYGICDVCGETIAEERLKASPAVVTCIKHSK